MHTQEFCVWGLNGINLTGVEFLSQLAHLYGVRLEFYTYNNLKGGFHDSATGYPTAKANGVINMTDSAAIGASRSHTLGDAPLRLKTWVVLF